MTLYVLSGLVRARVDRQFAMPMGGGRIFRFDSALLIKHSLVPLKDAQISLRSRVTVNGGPATRCAVPNEMLAASELQCTRDADDALHGEAVVERYVDGQFVLPFLGGDVAMTASLMAYVRSPATAAAVNSTSAARLRDGVYLAVRSRQWTDGTRIDVPLSRLCTPIFLTGGGGISVDVEEQTPPRETAGYRLDEDVARRWEEEDATHLEEYIREFLEEGQLFLRYSRDGGVSNVNLPQKAAESFDAVLRRCPDHGAARQGFEDALGEILRAGQILLGKNRPHEAADEFEAVLMMRRDNAAARQGFEDALTLMKRSNH